MPNHRTPPSAPRRRPPGAPARLLTALVRAALLLALTLCVLGHGPVGDGGDHHRTGAAAEAPAPASSEHHQPGGHHGGEECATDQAQRLPAAAPEPPAPGDPGPPAAVVARDGSRPSRGRRGDGPRAPGRRTGRARLVRTSRWRI
ncbi:hypothetical protein JNUCC64_31955 [Streptomyces sp. JNUCC 64]